jgi:hypothetical protein
MKVSLSILTKLVVCCAKSVVNWRSFFALLTGTVRAFPTLKFMRSYSVAKGENIMKSATRQGHFVDARFWAVLGALFLWSASALALTEETFDTLQIGARTYQNVTVTTKAKHYIFVLHSTGMANIKVADLPEDVLEKLGYAKRVAQKSPTNSAAAWAKQAVAKMDTPQVKEVEDKLSQAWQGAATRANSYVPTITPQLIALGATILLLGYLFHCYCCMLICQKTGNQPGIMVWLPVLQLVPMLRAASMSRWWVIGFFIPVVNLIGHVLWCVKIVEARHKTVPLSILLVFPVTSVFAFLYLAFSEAAPAKTERPPRVELMTLETA